jgi:hypothetical protein
MDRTYWHKQTEDTPLFPDLQWSRPENKQFAGKLLIIGGNAQGFAVPATAYTDALAAGVGAARVLLPDSLQRTVSKIFPAAEFAPANPSGGFARASLGEALPLAHWADGILLAGETGRNSETAILLESLLTKHTGQITITKDAADYFTVAPKPALNRTDTLLVISFSQLQKLGISAKFTTAFTFDTGILQLVDALHDFTEAHQLFIITKHLDSIFVAVNGQVSSTKLLKDREVWRGKTAAEASVWWLQNPSKPFEALTTAII